MLVETAIMNGLDEIIRMNELKMKDAEPGFSWSDTQPNVIIPSFYSLNCSWDVEVDEKKIDTASEICMEEYDSPSYATHNLK